jgi:hypothetical protein
MNFSGCINPSAASNCKQLNSFLEEGWKVVMVTPKSNYNEYIIEKEVKENNNNEANRD